MFLFLILRNLEHGLRGHGLGQLGAWSVLGVVELLLWISITEVEKVKCLSGKRKARQNTFCQKNKLL